MGVVEIRTFLVQRELINEAPARFNRILTNSRTAVHVVGNFKTVPVHGGRFRQMVVDDDADAISLVHLDGWPWGAAVEAPQINRFIRLELLPYGLGNQVKDFNAVVQRKWEIFQIR